MPTFGSKSAQNLASVHPILRAACEDAIRWMDFSVREGFRSADRQEEMYAAGQSKARAGQSKHNSNPSHAVDVYPYPLGKAEFESLQLIESMKRGRVKEITPDQAIGCVQVFARFAMLGGVIIQACQGRGWEARWGGDWNMDEQDLGAGFLDAPHVELVGPIKEA